MFGTRKTLDELKQKKKNSDETVIRSVVINITTIFYLYYNILKRILTEIRPVSFSDTDDLPCAFFLFFAVNRFYFFSFVFFYLSYSNHWLATAVVDVPTLFRSYDWHYCCEVIRPRKWVARLTLNIIIAFLRIKFAVRHVGLVYRNILRVFEKPFWCNSSRIPGEGAHEGTF